MFKSLCSDFVGIPVEGPPRITSTTTIGISAETAKPKASVIKAKPGPDVAVTEGMPPNDPPMIIFTEANSSSA